MRILLAFDGSNDAAQAASLVKGLALPPGSSVRIISVVEPGPVAVPSWSLGMTAYSPEIDAEVTAHYEAELATVVRNMSDPDRQLEAAVVRGRPASVIIDDARTSAADLIVIGSRGRGSIASLVLGSVSSEVVDHAPCPVLVARRPVITRAILGADGSPSARTAEDLWAGWSMFDGLPIRVVSVADVPRPWHTGIAPTMYPQVLDAYARDREQAKEQHRCLAEESVERLRAAGRDATADVRCGDAATEILGVTAEWGADLIVLGSRGRTGLTRFLLGSVARNLVHGSSASILVAREAATA